MDDLLKDLNDRQREAVTAPLGPALVLAGAGSGKTRVLTYRVAYLLKEKLFRPENLLALTFTNKAAGEMRERVIALTEELKNQRTKEPQVHKFLSSSVHPSLTMGTFHSVCARLLRHEIEKLTPPSPPLAKGGRGGGVGYTRNFVIYDTDDALRLLKQIVLELGLEERFKPQVFAYYIGQAKNRLILPEDLELDNSYLETTLQEVYEIYTERLRQNNALDFDDLLALTCKLFQEHKVVRQKYQNRFKYVLVDEYQDTNHAQYVFLKLLLENHRNLFVVGDDAQSIYGFRGANMQNILNFKNDYPEARIIMLEQNYRSTQPILDVARQVIKLNPFQYEKKLWTENKIGQKVNLYEANDEMGEAEFVLKRILNREYGISDQDRENHEVIYESEETPILNRFHIPYSRFEIPESLSDSVILYRTHAQSRPFEEVLLGSGVPYQIVGGIKFYERKEIKDVLSYLRLVLNPRDLVSLSRVVNEPARGIGPANFKLIAQSLPKYNYNYDRLLRNVERLELPAKATSGAKDFFSLYAQTSQLSKAKTLAELMHLVLAGSGYKDSLLDGSEEGQSRWENIEELFNVAAKFRRLPWQGGLQAFLEEVALMTDLDRLEEEENKLTLMTLHSAKGLEFEKVFFVGLEEGLLPHSRSLLSPQEIAEEIRLAYVGITRAKKHLYLTYARQRQSYGELKRCVPSRILKAIPKRLLRKLNEEL